MKVILDKKYVERTNSNAGTSYSIDLQGTMTHEIGHAMGLAHPTEKEDGKYFLNAKKTTKMYGYGINFNNPLLSPKDADAWFCLFNKGDIKENARRYLEDREVYEKKYFEYSIWQIKRESNDFRTDKSEPEKIEIINDLILAEYDGDLDRSYTYTFTTDGRVIENAMRFANGKLKDDFSFETNYKEINNFLIFEKKDFDGGDAYCFLMKKDGHYGYTSINASTADFIKLQPPVLEKEKERL